MSKNKFPDPSDAEDYLAQIQWKSKITNRRVPWYLIPNWKYKPILRTDYSKSTFSSIFIVGLFIIIIGYLIYSIIVYQSGEAVFGVIFSILALLVLFFASRDVRKNSNEDDDQSGNN